MKTGISKWTGAHWLQSTVAVGALFSLGACAGGLALIRGVEEPDYVVIKRVDQAELRQYPATIVAETLVDGSFEDSGSEGFRRLAGYIFGGNTQQARLAGDATVSQQAASSQKIAMTAPVGVNPAGNAWRVTFTMPAAYTLASLPKPNDSRVALREVPSQMVWATRFRGRWTKRAVDRRQERLLELVSAEQFTVAAEPVFARYDPPWIPPPFRRNEILVPVHAPR